MKRDFVKDATQRALAKRDAWVRDQVYKKKRTRRDVAAELGMTPQRVSQIAPRRKP